MNDKVDIDLKLIKIFVAKTSLNNEYFIKEWSENFKPFEQKCKKLVAKIVERARKHRDLKYSVVKNEYE